MKIYKVVKSTSLQKLELEVNQKLKSGYIPVGGIVCVKVPKTNEVIFLQAIYNRRHKAKTSEG